MSCIFSRDNFLVCFFPGLFFAAVNIASRTYVKRDPGRHQCRLHRPRPPPLATPLPNHRARQTAQVRVRTHPRTRPRALSSNSLVVSASRNFSRKSTSSRKQSRRTTRKPSSCPSPCYSPSPYARPCWVHKRPSDRVRQSPSVKSIVVDDATWSSLVSSLPSEVVTSTTSWLCSRTQR